MASGIIKQIFLFPEKGQPGIESSCATCIKNIGIQGDRFAKGGPKQVTAVDSKAWNWVHTHPNTGLCFKKFKANIVIDGLDFSSLQAGDILSCHGVSFEVSPEEKECFPDCILASKEIFCSLKSGVIYLKILDSGEIQTNSSIVVL